MSPLPSTYKPSQTDDPREIAKWTRVYAQNRTLGVAVFLLIFLVLSAAIGGFSSGAERASHNGNTVMLAVCLSGLIVALAVLIYLSVPAWGFRRMGRIASALYAREGRVTVTRTWAPGRGRLVTGLGLGFGACLLASVLLGVWGYLPDRYMQPVSAVYMVPFLVMLTLLQRPAIGWITLLWPALYGLHAVLIVAGAPIVFLGTWSVLNMVIPTIGYGLLTSLLGHMFNRYALHSVKQLARTEPSGDDRREGGT